MRHEAAAVLMLSCASALAQQGPTDIATLGKYAGTWALACGEAGGTRLVVGVESLCLEAGGQRLKTAPPLSAFSYFGKAPPPAGFEVALLGEARPTGLTFLAMKDPSGPYLTVAADTALERQFGKAALAGRFRRCP